jgi:tetracycline 7-halogenase / FADH2 O2-dependent halogenase
VRGVRVIADYDIAVVGSGFAGSLVAMIARRSGKSVILLERSRHPRFAIGESTTPLSNLLLEELSLRYGLPNLLPLCKWGSWRKAYPELACGLKRGFTFYYHQLGRRAALGPDRQNQLLVAASPHDAIADTHWYRADVDAFFVSEARKAGVDYLDEVRLESACEQARGMRLEAERRGERFRIEARFVVDATGPRGFLHRALHLPELALPDMPETEALYTHFRNVGRLADLPEQPPGEQPPYPVDDAAVHHVFEGGWIWVLRFANGVTSAGIACTAGTAERFGFGNGGAAWDRILRAFPTIRAQFAEAVPDRTFVHGPRLAFRSAAIAGRRWALLPSAAGFVDPLLSTGFPLTLLGVARLAEILQQDWESPQLAAGLAAYARKTEEELLATARLIGAMYANMADFPVFVSLSMLYFAAASFSETARRLGRKHLAASFLLHDDPRFPARQILERSREVRTEAARRALRDDILRLIEPFNVAALGDPRRRNWYPVNAEDLLSAAPKLGVDRKEMARVVGQRASGNFP